MKKEIIYIWIFYKSLLMSFLLLYSCKTLDKSEVENVIIDRNEKNKIEDVDVREKEIPFEFLDFKYFIDTDLSLEEKSNVYKVLYRAELQFKNSSANFRVKCSLYDEQNNQLSQKEELSITEVSDNVYKSEFQFYDYFLYKTIRFSLDIEKNGERYSYVGEYTDSLLPELSSISLGPIVSRYIDSKVNTSLFVSAEITDQLVVKWVRVIPPSENYYWNLPIKKEAAFFIGEGSVNDNDHPQYMDNGNYFLQVSFGKYGIIQKPFTIVDYFGNKSGPNYGIPIANQLNSNKDSIELSLELREKIDYMEFWIYSDIGDNKQKLGSAKFYSIVDKVSKKELFKSFYDDSGVQLKLKHNKKYFYRVYLHSKTFSEIKYVSISELYEVVFYGFGIFTL